MKIFKTVSEDEFSWWKVFGILQIVGAVFVFLRGLIENQNYNESLGGIFLLIGIIQLFFAILILKYNKYAFLIATILSINPLLWIINGIYLANRWCHPKVNNGVSCGKYLEQEALNKFREEAN